MMTSYLNTFYSYLLGALLLLHASTSFATEQEQAYDGPMVESYKLEAIYSEEGIVKLRMHTNEEWRYESGDLEYPEGVYVEFYEEGKDIVATARANSVYFFAEQNDYEFRGDVEIKSLREKRQLNTDEVHWHPDTATFYTDKFVRIEAENNVLTGEGGTAKQDLSHYTISQPQGELEVKSTNQKPTSE